MIVLCGESASGKTTLLNAIVKDNPTYRKVVTYTTRPMRDGEVNGIDYHFISTKKFDKYIKQNFFVEHTQHNGWYYGTAKEDCANANAVLILTPSGLRSLKRDGYDITSIYLYVDRRSRLINSILRGDNIEEAYRRSLSDVGMFDGIINEVDCVIDNTEFHMSETEVLECFRSIMEQKNSTHMKQTS